MKVPTTREWALAYAALGWRVFPVVAGGKRPMYAGWQRDATTDSDLVARYWRREPGPNIGLICGEAFDAFDIEVAHLPVLWAWLQAHDHQLPDTPIAQTGRGGVHVLVRARARTAGHVLRLDGVRIGELKAAGGFVVACPSRTVGVYAWHRSPLEVVPADAPAWLSGLASERRITAAPLVQRPVGPLRGEARLAALARTVAWAAEGRRNDLLYWAMRRALDDGIPATIAASVLARMAIGSGLGEREVEATIASARSGTAS